MQKDGLGFQRKSVPGSGRLQGRSAFFRIRASGRRIRVGPLVATALYTGEAAKVGFALPISLGNAVVRNRMRRQLRAILREVEMPQVNIVIRPSSRCVGFTYDRLQQAVIELVLQVCVLCVEPSGNSGL